MTIALTKFLKEEQLQTKVIKKYYPYLLRKGASTCQHIK